MDISMNKLEMRMQNAEIGDEDYVVTIRIVLFVRFCAAKRKGHKHEKGSPERNTPNH